jgi:hypothetical protein
MSLESQLLISAGVALLVIAVCAVTIFKRKD